MCGDCYRPIHALTHFTSSKVTHRVLRYLKACASEGTLYNQHGRIRVETFTNWDSNWFC